MNDNKTFAIVVSVFASFAFTALAISEYQGGKTEQLEMQLKIEQEKTKQLQHDGTNNKTWYNQDK